MIKNLILTLLEPARTSFAPSWGLRRELLVPLAEQPRNPMQIQLLEVVPLQNYVYPAK